MKIVSVLMVCMLLTGCGVSSVFVAQGGIGLSGSNGHSAAFSQLAADSSLCTNGGTVLSAGVDLNDNLTLETDETKVVAVTCNGVDGSDGNDGANGADGVSPVLPGMTPVAVLNPCGDAPGVYDEVLLKLANGSVLSSFSDNASGLNTRFGILPPGTYQTTDGTGCVFTLDSNGNLL